LLFKLNQHSPNHAPTNSCANSADKMQPTYEERHHPTPNNLPRYTIQATR